MMPVRKGLGWRKDRPDWRDHRYAAPAPITSALPPSVDLRPGMPDVWDQGNLGSCTAHAVGAVLVYAMTKEGEPPFMPARLMIYYGERVLENSVTSDAGAEIRDGMKVIASQGVCAEQLWPYAPDKFAEKPPAECYQAATAHEAIEYRAVDQSLAQMKGCLAEGFPLTVGFTVYDSFMSDAVAKTGIVPLPTATESVQGGHAVVIAGYDDSRQWFMTRNSWGRAWGDKGYFYFPYSYALDPNLSSDLWTVRKTT
jgi:C1A family cysteine protease